MDKPLGNIKFTETENGFRLDIDGKDLKELFSRCCGFSSNEKAEADCCSSGSSEAEKN